MTFLNNLIKRTLAARGYRLQKVLDPDMGKEFEPLHKAVQKFTMTSYERQHALYNAVKYILENNIEGDIVECGVWKGGSMMLVAQMLKDANQVDRTLYLYDTFAGMTEPTEKDVSHSGNPSWDRWKEQETEGHNEWDYAGLAEVRQNLASIGYPMEKIKFVAGPVEETIPGIVPQKIALLRLDTDWYESTRHELEHLFPRLSEKGILIIDDYGHWKGARQAVDEYLSQNHIPLFLNRIDYTGRIAVK